MKFLPTEDIIYKTKLQEDEIKKRLLDTIEPEKLFRFMDNDSSNSYEGQIDGQTFDIKRIIRYRNSFLPRIHGDIERGLDGIIIKIKMRLHIFVIVFLCIWSGGVGLACAAFLPAAFRNPDFRLIGLIPLGMLLFVYGLTMGGFKFESQKSKKDLQKLFEADIINQ